MREGLDSASSTTWKPLMDFITADHAAHSSSSSSSVPFQVFSKPISPHATSQDLHATYTCLHSKAHSAVEHYITTGHKDLAFHDQATSICPFSYNLALTTQYMAIIPRRSEGAPLRSTNDGAEIGFAAFNGTVLAGTMMVKNKEEWELLRSEEGLLDRLLGQIGIPWEDIENVDAGEGEPRL
jgi:ATP adenylyltransferase